MRVCVCVCVCECVCVCLPALNMKFHKPFQNCVGRKKLKKRNANNTWDKHINADFCLSFCLCFKLYHVWLTVTQSLLQVEISLGKNSLSQCQYVDTALSYLLPPPTPLIPHPTQLPPHPHQKIKSLTVQSGGERVSWTDTVALRLLYYYSIRVVVLSCSVC